MPEKTPQGAPYSQGEYAGPLTTRAMDYNGHEAIGVQISDVAADGSCYFVTIDKHMQLSVAPVIADSIRSYDPPEPPPQPECSIEDLQSTGEVLADLLNRLMAGGPVDTPEKLMQISVATKNLATVWFEQKRRAEKPLRKYTGMVNRDGNLDPDYAEDVR